MNSLCFVILNYRQCAFVIRDVANIEKLCPSASFVIVDNNSEDGSFETLSQELGQKTNIRIISNFENSGYARGNNLGIEVALSTFSPEFVAIMNPDVVIPNAKVIEDSVDSLKRNEDLAICTGLMLNGTWSLNWRLIGWRVPDKLDDVLMNLPIISSIFGPIWYKSHNVTSDGLLSVESVPGSFFIAKASCLRRMGFFDERTFLYCEERILGARAKRLGLKMSLVPGSFFVHDHPKEKKSFASTMKSYFHLISSRFYYNKAYNSWPKWIVLPPFIVSAGFGYFLTALLWLVKRTVHCFKRSLKKGKSQ